ncbi:MULTISPECIES: ATP-binding protein [Streptomyces]|uniref:ATP-binding protein n=1 Tax=Streptomyces TaxID=1883 RepID=UPI000CD4F8DD|nr:MULTISPECIES: ATP-binding protein [Streptomyces]
MSAAQSVPSGTGPEPPSHLAEVTHQVRRLRLLGVSGTVARARGFTRQALCDWGWLPAESREIEVASEDVLLVVSELVTNACLHAKGPEELRIGCRPDRLRLEVTDPDAGTPTPRDGRAPGRPGGHGIFIVQRLSLDWGVISHPDGSGKTVWADMAAPPGL